jgi:regulator of protease activity HflC (stomatin/prohibitin superfamily)
MNTQMTAQNRERLVKTRSGWGMLPVVLGLCLGSIALFIYAIAAGTQQYNHPIWGLFIPSLLAFPFSIILMMGFYALQPKEARVLLLFGEYRGTVRESGFYWGNPFYANGVAGHTRRPPLTEEEMRKGAVTRIPPGHLGRFKVSLRARNLITDKIKVNDKRGNPIEIATVVVWRVEDTAQAVFDVDDYENYVRIQSESAVRHLASCYAYDHGEEHEVTLRSGVEEVSQSLRVELQERLGKAGVVVEEARLTHLAYAPEIAQVMLRRQQAEAIIAARQKIVHGAVSMVEMALKDLAEKHVVELDDERKAAMVSNLMVVLCSESEVHPVVNTGTLYP